MTSVDEALDVARDKAADILNSEGRHPGHVALGVAFAVGFAVAATAVASQLVRPHRAEPEQRQMGKKPIVERPRGAVSLILPALFSATTLSALRIWNAPSGPERTAALRLWGLFQAVNAAWIAYRPHGRSLQMAAAMSSAGLAAAYAHEARKLDPSAGFMASPTGGAVRLGNLVDSKVSEEPALH